ncbi:hypothetical protein C4580_06015 [Candidatus Woesearchaeota archaeon]|nr:MAG: hypothetical protein C4580_06015 [Candidatus Woesearchaeota archaeon]
MQKEKDFLFDTAGETLFGVIGKMHVQTSILPRSLHPFHHAYRMVTERVGAERALDGFDDPCALEELDLHFAQLYFDPLRNYLQEKNKITPWKTYFSYTAKKPIPFCSMLLGINAHINADLAQTIHELRYNNRRDFRKINKILEHTIPDLMNYLAFTQHDLFGLGGVLFPRSINTYFHRIIVRWREDAWKNARRFDLDEIHRQTEQVAAGIITAFADITSLRHAVLAVRSLEQLSVKT